jgi:hypothetical protein
MPSPQLARDEEVRCVSPQRIVASSASRVLPFRAPVVELSIADRLERLADIDPEGAAMIARAITTLYDHANGPTR